MVFLFIVDGRNGEGLCLDIKNKRQPFGILRLYLGKLYFSLLFSANKIKQIYKTLCIINAE